MDNRINAHWPENQLQLSSDRGTSILPSPYGSGSLPPFVGSSYPASLTTSSNFGTSSDLYPHTASTSGSYDSLPASISTSQLYEESSNDSSVISGSVFTNTLGPSSVSSGLTSAGYDDLSEVSSRKASLSSIHDGPLPNHLVHSPEIEASPGWLPSATSAVQPSSHYGLCYGSATDNATTSALTSASFYNSTAINSGSSQAVNPYTYSNPMQLITPANLSSLQTSMPVSHHPQHGTTLSMSVPATTTPSNLTSPPIYSLGGQASTMSIQTPKTKLNTKGRSSTSGSTRRAKFQRSRTGCMICRKRKVKCDQDGQPCKQCRVGKRDCHYEDNPPKRKRLSKSKSDSDSALKERESSEEAESIFPDEVEAEMLKSQIISSVAEPAKEEVRRAREVEDEIRRTNDALFAQHTNFDQVEGEEDSRILHSFKREDDVDSYSMQYPDPSDASTPWTGRSDPTASISTEGDWSTDTPSTGPSSLRTTDEDPLHFVHLDLEDESHGNAIVHQSWYRGPELSESALGIDLAMNDDVLK